MHGHAELTRVNGTPLHHICRYIDLLSKLWAYKVKKSDMSGLVDEAARTLTDLETYFPAWDLDINRHMVLHMAQHLKLTGPCWAINMLPFERLWKSLISWMKQTQHPETTMMFNFSSFRAALHLDALLRDQGEWEHSCVVQACACLA
jgi:hypothetical protein